MSWSFAPLRWRLALLRFKNNSPSLLFFLVCLFVCIHSLILNQSHFFCLIHISTLTALPAFVDAKTCFLYQTLLKGCTLKTYYL